MKSARFQHMQTHGLMNISVRTMERIGVSHAVMRSWCFEVIFIYSSVIYVRFWLINRVAVGVKGKGGFRYGRKLGTPAFLLSDGRFKRPGLSTDF